jgi:hypothetical protein
MGADVRLTRSDVPRGHPDYYMDLAETLAQQIPAASTSTSSAIPPIRRLT